MNKAYTIGIDLGGTKTLFGLIDENGNIISEHRENTSNSGKELLNSLINGSKSLIRQSIEFGGEVKAIGIGSPGRIDSKKGIVVDCTPNIKDWQGTNIKESFETNFNIPCFIDNDANVAAFGEFKLQKNNKNNNSTIIVLTLGTGLGSGIIHNGTLFRGKGLGSEIGHMILEVNGRPCNCGQKGCFEMYVSGTALENQAKERLFKYPDSILNKIEGKITAYNIFKYAKENDLFSLVLIDEMSEYLAHSLVSLINIFDPDMVLLSGGISKQSEMFLEKAIQIVEKTINYNQFKREIIQIAQSDEKSGLIGAGLIAFDGLNKGEI